MKQESVGGDNLPTRLHTTDKIFQNQPHRLTVGLAFNWQYATKEIKKITKRQPDYKV